MKYFLYFLNIICLSGQSALSKQYSVNHGNSRSFNINKAFSGIILFLIFAFFEKFEINMPTLLYSIIYGIFLSISMHFGFKALGSGPIGLTSIIVSFSLLIPFIYGITVWEEKLTIYGVIGLLLLMISISFLNYKKESNISAKWLGYVAITMLSNGICSVIQKYHQISFPSLYREEFMFMALICVFLIFTLTSKFTSEKERFKFSLLGLIAGALNGLSNYIIIFLASTEKASALFPIASVSNIIAVWIVGRVFFKEKFNFVMIIGLIFGIAAIILLNL